MWPFFLPNPSRHTSFDSKIRWGEEHVIQGERKITAKRSQLAQKNKIKICVTRGHCHRNIFYFPFLSQLQGRERKLTESSSR